MDRDTHARPQYDIPTAVTFLIAGLGLGSILTLLFVPPLKKGAFIASGASSRATQ